MIAAPSDEPIWRNVLVTPDPSPASVAGTDERVRLLICDITSPIPSP
jgi:hypothetical protein